MEAHDERVGWVKTKWEKRREKQRKSEQSRDETLQQRSHLINTTSNEAGSQKNLHLSNPSRAPPLTARSRAQTPLAPTSAGAGEGVSAHQALLHLPLLLQPPKRTKTMKHVA